MAYPVRILWDTEPFFDFTSVSTTGGLVFQPGASRLRTMLKDPDPGFYMTYDIGGHARERNTPFRLDFDYLRRRR